MADDIYSTSNAVQQAKADAIAKEWGWTSPPDWVLEEAMQTCNFVGLKAHDVAVRMGLCTEEDAEKAQQRKTNVQRPIDFMAANIPRVAQSLSRIQAYCSKIQFIERLNDPSIATHPDMARPEIAAACAASDAVLMMVQGVTRVLVFSDYEGPLKRFQSIAGLTRSSNILYKNYPDHKIALTSPEQLASVGQKTQGQQSSQEVESEEIVTDAELRGDDGPLKKFAQIMELSMDNNASDIYLDPDNTHRVLVEHKVMGQVEQINVKVDPYEYQTIKRYLLQKSKAEIKFGRLTEPKDGMFQYVGKKGKSAYIRCSFIPLSHSGTISNDLVSICLRLIPVERGAVSLQEMGVAPGAISYMRSSMIPKQGIVMVVGATGAGKSTTVSGMIGLHHEIHGDTKKRYSIEDPVERFLPSISQIQIPYHLRNKGQGFSLILRNLLRQAPDMINIGEIRDSETAEIAVAAAATGHLILSTTHADSVTKAVDRLSNLMPSDRPDMKIQLIENISLVVAQRLVRGLCPKCSTVGETTQEEHAFAEWLERQKGFAIKLPSKVARHNPSGCDHAEGNKKCRGGFVGRIPVLEIMQFTREAQMAYLEPPSPERSAKISELVNITMEHAILDLISKRMAEPKALQP